MGIPKLAKLAIGILNRFEKIKFIILSVLGILTAFLDILGVFLIGFLAFRLSNFETRNSLPNVFVWLDSIWKSRFANYENGIIVVVFIIVIIFLLKAMLAITLSKLVLNFLSDVAVRISKESFSKLLKMPLSKSQQISSQEVILALNYGSSGTTFGILFSLSMLFADLALFILMISGSIIYNFQLTFYIMLGFISVFTVFHNYFSKLSRTLGNQRINSEVKTSTQVQDALSSRREILIMGIMNRISDEIAGSRKSLYEAITKLQWLSITPRFLLELVLAVFLALLLFYSLTFNNEGEGLVNLVFFLAVGTRLLPSMLRIQSSLNTILSSQSSLERIFNFNKFVFANSDEINISRNVKTSPYGKALFEPSVRIEEVSYRYPFSDRNSLEGVTMNISSGEFVVITGRTGSGKSTLVDLILGIDKPTTGQITLGSLEPSMAVSNWQSQIAYVPQVSHLLGASIRDNVLFYRDMPSEDEIWNVLELVEMQEFVRDLDGQLDYILSEKGSNISGGQRQRIALARALLSKPKMLILDEATSALDSETEHSIINSLRKFRNLETIIFVSHQLSMIKTANRIFHFDNGSLKSQGNFDYLFSNCISFKSMLSEISPGTKI